MSINSANQSSQELEKFNRLANDWWDSSGPFRPLHIMNPVRLNYINDFVDLHGKKVLDVGCGGGILAESMARREAHVTGIDKAEKTLDIARNHARQHGLSIDYHNIHVEQLADQAPQSFDVITCLEMLEHVPNPESVVAACSKLIKPNGWVFFSTINRTVKAFLFAIIGAEYILKLLPKGTHSYATFIRPSELIDWAENSGLLVQDTSGLLYNPLTEKFTIAIDPSVNYLITARKKNG